MAYEMREGQGNLFKNDKQGKESRPDYRGEIMVGGQVYRLSAWLKDGRKGKFMSINAQLKEDRPVNSVGEREQPRPTKQDEFDDDIPF